MLPMFYIRNDPRCGKAAPHLVVPSGTHTLFGTRASVGVGLRQPSISRFQSVPYPFFVV